MVCLAVSMAQKPTPEATSRPKYALAAEKSLYMATNWPLLGRQHCIVAPCARLKPCWSPALSAANSVQGKLYATS